jgi:pyridoxamine 5'-phosphate oxidase-like protein
MTKTDLFEFFRRHRYGVISSVSASGAPQSAVVGIGVSSDLEIVFDTLRSSRKYANLIANPAVSVTVWTGEATAQIEGVACEPDGPGRERYREIYFETWPDGRDRLNWSGLTHIVIRPNWIRYSDFDQRPPLIEEFRF